MPHYAVRITHSYSVAQRIVAAWAPKCERMAVFEHKGDKTGKVHIHLALYATSVDKKQLRNIAATTAIPVKGNENMAFEVWSGLEASYCYYMTKGHIDASYLMKYTTDDVKRWQEAWVEPAKHVKLSVWQKLWNEYEPDAPPIRQFYDDGSIVPENLQFKQLATHVHLYIYKLNGYTWCPQMTNQKKCLINTYCNKMCMKKPKDWLTYVDC
jgi:hypothetical protein